MAVSIVSKAYSDRWRIATRRQVSSMGLRLGVGVCGVGGFGFGVGVGVGSSLQAAPIKARSSRVISPRRVVLVSIIVHCLV